MAKYNYGRAFIHEGVSVRYRYTNKDKKTKTLVYAKSKKLYFGRKGKYAGRRK